MRKREKGTIGVLRFQLGGLAGSSECSSLLAPKWDTK